MPGYVSFWGGGRAGVLSLCQRRGGVCGDGGGVDGVGEGAQVTVTFLGVRLG